MSTSDGSVRSLELWNDGPAVQAMLSQMQLFQTQMQRQMQEQLTQMQLQMGSFQMPQASYGLQAASWPQPGQPQMPCQLGQVFVPQKSKVRTSRRGKRERAEVKAARLTQVQKSEGSEEETSGDGWLLAGEGIDGDKQDGKSESRGAAAGDASAGGAGVADSRVRNAVPATHQQLIQPWGTVVDAGTENNRKELKEMCEKMVTAAVAQITKVIYACKNETDDALAGLRTALKTDFSDMCKTAKGEAMASVELSCKDALVRIESEQVNTRANLGQQTAALQSKVEHSMSHLEEEMHDFANKMNVLQLSVHNLKPELNAERSVRSHEIIEVVSNNMTDLQNVVKEAQYPLRVLRDVAAKATNTPQMRDSSVQCDRATAQEMTADRFDPSAKGKQIVLADSDSFATHSGNTRLHNWQTVYGKCLTHRGRYEWQLKIEKSLRAGDNNWQMIVGVARHEAGIQLSSFLSDRENTGFGYIQLNGKKTNGLHDQHYACAYAAGDVVTVVLDMDNHQLSFKKNHINRGFSHQIPPGSYRLSVSLGCSGHAVRILSSRSA